MIIGHTTHDSTRVWIRAKGRVVLEVTARGDAPMAPISKRFYRRDDHTGVVTIRNLKPATHYTISVSHQGLSLLRSGRESRCARVTTFPHPDAPQVPFTFVHASCNLSVPRATKLVALGLGYLGTHATRQTLRRSADTWVPPRIDPTRQPPRSVTGLRRAWWRTRPVWAPLLNGVRGALARSALLREVVSVSIRAPGRIGARWLLAGVGWLTRFEQSRTFLRSPLARVRERAREVSHPAVPHPAFMVHAGDQIYFDVDLPAPTPDLVEYRRAYRQAWFEDPDMSALLRSLPHYMILDDHELVNDFDNLDTQGRFRTPGLRAYREYVAQRYPAPEGRADPDALHYTFSHGTTRFFVMDTRTERDSGQMISRAQEDALCAWLERYRGDLKFVVSAVPFVAEVRPRDDSARGTPGGQRDGVPPEPGIPGTNGSQREQATAGAAAAMRERASLDKWSGPTFRAQRSRILDVIFEKDIPRVVFLVGDMHCAYHATLGLAQRADTPAAPSEPTPRSEPRRRITVHELAGGPIHQVQFARRSHFHTSFRGVTPRASYTSHMQVFQGGENSVLEVGVSQNGVDWCIVPCRTLGCDHPEGRVPTITGKIRF